ncbi:Flp pilus assembly protein CpaB [Nocardioides acrostichi]|uniref:Flp pilus assembly protein CpaB n=1 Tax=Nocardioides acrostichi TaxID=2784339 RepID=A0A930Y651_9ACTN|nr:Flp pilus assembly protein CpaB [Nocardioides acrostichi]MBF4160566.1 Flp pilus assembly protein CpaB [Nocardioides acrostichi]
MDRRRILLIAAALVAALGTVLVLLYAKGADKRAEEKFDTATALVAIKQIDRGESVSNALAAAKIAEQQVPAGQLLPGALSSADSIASDVALTTVYPGEQIIAEKFGDTASEESRLVIPDKGDMAMSINLTDPARVAGFVNPGSEVSVYVTGTDPRTGQPFSRILLTGVKVLAVGSTTPVTTTSTGGTGTTDQSGQVVEQLPRTLITLSVSQQQMQRVLLGQQQGELSFALLTDKSKVNLLPATTLDNLFQN